ncbi:MAG: hypothetical protein DBX97_02885, partial [Collinsella tanakaei]
MQYRDIYKVLEHRWKTVLGVRFMDFSGWCQPRTALRHRSRLLVVVEDQTSMRRICISHNDGPLTITYAPIGSQGCNNNQPMCICCKNEEQAAMELERLFVQLDQ